VNGLSCRHVSRSLPGKTHLFLGAKKQDIRQRCLDCVPDATPAI
jgi:hypothetical protein